MKKIISRVSLSILLLAILVGCETKQVETGMTTQKEQTEQTGSPMQQSKTNAGTKSLTFDEINQNKSEWEEKYNQLVENNVSSSYTQEVSERLNARALGNTNEKGVLHENTLDLQLPSSDGLIDKLVQNQWDAETLMSLLGTEDTFFRFYHTYFDKGVAVKVLNNKLSTVVFSTKYSENVVGTLTMKSTIADVTKTLGSPTFENADEKIIGYKTTDFYIFLIGAPQIYEIAVYPRGAAFIREQLVALADFSNEMMPIPDWEAGTSALTIHGYDAQGIVVWKNEADQKVKIDCYRNFLGDTTVLDRGNQNIEVVQHTEQDSVFELEQYRVLLNKRLVGEKASDISLGMAFDREESRVMSPKGTKIAFLKNATADDNYACVYVLDVAQTTANIEILVDPMNTQISWVGEQYLVCKGNDISFIMDLESKKVIPLPEKLFGKVFEIVKIEKDTIEYLVEGEK